jgi:hypothetical protein
MDGTIPHNYEIVEFGSDTRSMDHRFTPVTELKAVPHSVPATPSSQHCAQVPVTEDRDRALKFH